MLELIETMVMGVVGAAVGVLDASRTLGFGLPLDDFGTGSSPLSPLSRLPMSELKIERAFIADVARGGRAAALAAAISTLDSELNLQSRGRRGGDRGTGGVPDRLWPSFQRRLESSALAVCNEPGCQPALA